ncbi:MAG: HD domain-containing protein, partial [Lachnospiraceae bacterium]|nr:HD domain-containing protein [Lachnospiraceae bacterium]
AYHHERWDGKGYPEGLHGEVIPLSARIVALADALDDLISPRRFQISYSIEEAFEIILKELAKCEDKYETLLCSSCCARFIGLANNTSLEGDTYLGRLPKHISLIGMYGYGEYCPVTGKETGRRYNMFHNYTFTILAF